MLEPALVPSSQEQDWWIFVGVDRELWYFLRTRIWEFETGSGQRSRKLGILGQTSVMKIWNSAEEKSRKLPVAQEQCAGF